MTKNTTSGSYGWRGFLPEDMPSLADVLQRIIGPPAPSRDAARRALGLDLTRPTLGLFPGSRASEVRHLWPEFRAAAAQVRARRPTLQVILAGVRGAEYPDPGAIQIHSQDPTYVFAAADAAICKAGTTTLEATTPTQCSTSSSSRTR